MIAALLVPAASVDAAVGIDPGTVEVGQPIAPDTDTVVGEVTVRNPGSQRSAYAMYAQEAPEALPISVEWFTFEPSGFELDPGATQVITVRIRPDAGASPGRYTAMLTAALATSVDSPAAACGVIWPEGEGRRSLHPAATMPYTHVLVSKRNGPGEPELIVQPGPMTFFVHQEGLFPAGSHRIGLACTKYRETAAFWDAEIVIADPPEVEPGRFTWSVADDTADACAQSDPDRSGVWVVALVGAAVVGAAVVISRHRSLRTHTKPKEQS